MSTNQHRSRPFFPADAADGHKFVVWARPMGGIGKSDPDVWNSSIGRVLEWAVLYRRKWTVSVIPSDEPGFRRSVWKEHQPTKVDAVERARHLATTISRGSWLPGTGPPPS